MPNSFYEMNTREVEFEQIKMLIKENINIGDLGLYDNRNSNNDLMEPLFVGDYFDLDICYQYSYFEVFGTTEDEFKELCRFYVKILNEMPKEELK